MRLRLETSTFVDDEARGEPIRSCGLQLRETESGQIPDGFDAMRCFSYGLTSAREIGLIAMEDAVRAI